MYVIKNQRGSIIAITDFEPSDEILPEGSWYEEEIPFFSDEKSLKEYLEE